MLVERTGWTVSARLTRVVRDVPSMPGPPARVAEEVLRAVSQVIGADGGALVLMDPQTSLFTTGAVDRLPAASCHPFFRFEVDSESPRTFRRRAATGRGAVAVSADTSADGYREAVLEPYGYADELRVVCRDAGAPWAGLSLWRRPTSGPFSVRDVQALDAAAGMIGAILRDSVLRSIGATPDPGTRHVVVLDDGEVVESSESSATDLAELSDPVLEEFRHLDHLKELARRDARFSTVIGVADGRWLAVHGTPLGPGRVAIVLTSATPSDLFGVVVAGAGLSPREIEVTRLICRGHSDAEIASLLHISPHTAHDHVRAVRTKLGVRSRAEVAAKVFAERYFDGFLASAAVSHD
jgi:DNA-binding CsgD family transcriptional regulator